MGTSACIEFGGCYRAVRLLKQGHGIDTLIGRDLTEDRAVLIKTAAPDALPIQVLLRLEREAPRLRVVRSPSLVPILSYDRAHNRVILVRPYVAGVSLQERLDKGPPLRLRETLTLGCGLFEALREAHERGVFHLHLKPSELILVEPAAGRCVLTDFGLARERVAISPQSPCALNQFPYLSPEQAGIISHPIDERADLYAAGALLFTCLAGRTPFRARTIGELLRQHLTTPAPTLRSLGLHIPRTLDDVISRLLRKDPGDRYQSAQAVLADLSELTKALDRGHLDPTIVVGCSDRRQSLTEPPFIGRSPELAAFSAELEHARQGTRRLVLLEAPSGGGKTALLDEFEQASRSRGAWVLRGEGLTQAARRPFQVLDGVSRSVLDAVRADPGLQTALLERLGDSVHRSSVCTVLPQLVPVFSPYPSQALGPDAYGEIRGLQGLCALLTALGTADTPAVILFDDCQWTDELTLRLLGQWYRGHGRPPDPPCHVLIVAAFRSEEVPDGHPLRNLSASTRLTLSPFSADEIRSLVTSMAGPLPEEGVQIVTQFAEGSPFMAKAIVRGLVESRGLEPEPSVKGLPSDKPGWRLAPQAWVKVQSSRQAAVILTRRLDFLSADTFRLLSIGAVLGQKFDLELVASLARQTTAHTCAALAEARQRHLVWIDASRSQGVFIHHKIRQALLDRLPMEDQRELHKRAARLIEATDRERPYEAAYHFAAAGEHRQALPHALRAARQARSQYALETAEHYYRVAERGVTEADTEARLALAMGLGDVLMLRGRYDEAAKWLGEARSLTQDVQLLAKIEGQLGELAFKRGNAVAAAHAIERALRLLGRTVPTGLTAFAALTVWEGFIQALHTLLPRVFVGRRPVEGADAELLAVRLHSRLTYAYFFFRGAIPSLWSHLRELNLAERYPPTEEMAQAYSEHAVITTMLPLFRRSLQYAEKGLTIRRLLGNVWGQAQSMHFYGIALYTQARFAEALEKCRRAVMLLERTADRWEMNVALYHIALCLFRMGDLRGAIETSQRLHQIGLEIGDAHASGISFDPWAKASGGRVPAEALELALEGSHIDPHTRIKLLQAKALVLLQQGRAGDATTALTEARTIVRRIGMRSEYVASVPIWLATALRSEAAAVPAHDPQRRETLLRRARAAAREGLRLARAFPNNLPHAWREYGWLAAMQGRPRRSLRCLEQSLRVSAEQGALYEHAQTLLAKGHIGTGLGWPGAAEDLAAGQQAMHLLTSDLARQEPNVVCERAAGPRQVSVSLVDRFDTLLEVGRRITSALSRDAIFSEVYHAVRTLLRGEQCAALEARRNNGTVEWRTAAGEVDGEVGLTLAGRTLTSSRPLVLSPESQEESLDSLIAAGMRTALCTPILAHGQVVGCFCAVHRQVNGLFGQEEVRLAEFIATLAGAALEKADGFASLHQAHQQLQARADDAALSVEISAVVTGSGSLRLILQECAELLARHFNAACVQIWTYNESTAILDQQASAGLCKAIDGIYTGIPVAVLTALRVVQNRQPYLTNALSRDPLIQEKAWAEREGLISFAATPLTVENRVAGVVAMGARRPFPDNTLQKLSLIAECLAQCMIRKWADEEIRILNQQLEERVARRTQELEAAKEALERELVERRLHERRLSTQYAVTRLLADSPTLHHAVGHILQTIGETLGWPVGLFWQVDQQGGLIRCVHAWSLSYDNLDEFTALTGTTAFPAGMGLPGRVWALASPVWIPDVTKEAGCALASSACKAGLHCAFGVPILSGGNVLGVLEFLNSLALSPDPGLLTMMASVGIQIGQFIERKQAEESLRASEERFRTVAETAAEALITMDDRGQIVFVNRAAEHIFGYTTAEMLGKDITMLMPERFHTAHKAGMARFLATGKRHLSWEAVHLPGRHKSGKEVPLELAFWEFTQHGRKYFSSIVRDITDHVQAAELRDRLLEQVILAQEEERRRIARELHDETGQSLMSLLVGLQTIEASQTLENAKAHVQEYKQFVAKTLDEVHRLAMGLRPSVLDDLGLMAALECYAAGYRRTYKIAVDLQTVGLDNGRLPSPIEITLYRIIQEALTNIAKHAAASIVSVVIERQEAFLQVIVEDNGCGFDVEATFQSLPMTKHFGLLSMQERAGLVGGTIMIESTPGVGTTVCVKIPLRERHRGEHHGQNQSADRR